jgi:superfamily II DNA helicase RecQ
MWGPSGLNNLSCDDVMPRLAATTGLVVIDEAHCISDWGHRFQTDYRRLRIPASARLAHPRADDAFHRDGEHPAQ